jgi:endonuclease G
MIKIRQLVFFNFFLVFFSVDAQNHSAEQENYPKNAKRLEFPLIRDDESVIMHHGYSLVYDEPCEQAKWIAYVLTKKETEGLEDRGNKFIQDPFVHTGSASNDDYTKSGYDRGHLAPAADMKWSETAMKESFFYSNMSPQTPSFNRGIWKKLEEKMRDWALVYDSILIVTGPVLTGNLKKIGVNEVCVPDYYYKVIIDYKKDKSKAIGFIMPNSASPKPLSDYAKSIDEVEKTTGIDFFFQFNDEFEEKLESKICIPCWEW